MYQICIYSTVSSVLSRAWSSISPRTVHGLPASDQLGYFPKVQGLGPPWSTRCFLVPGSYPGTGSLNVPGEGLYTPDSFCFLPIIRTRKRATSVSSLFPCARAIPWMHKPGASLLGWIVVCFRSRNKIKRGRLVPEKSVLKSPFWHCLVVWGPYRLQPSFSVTDKWANNSS